MVACTGLHDGCTFEADSRDAGHSRVHSGAQTEALCAGTPTVESDAHGAALSPAVSGRGVPIHAPKAQH
ncbi:hypothetical protein TcasGA2_TC008008 [Tribolium castaneum]|uniref:Uncharacterized protein n=1 Tax=Tribolium castaneum TaxID=7070 RepID=D1ZZA2_TRICA|nr:hypothetical protein TcasGA2_TC008008 [Tribolium castaneum]